MKVKVLIFYFIVGQMEICDLVSNVPDIDSFDASYFGIHRQQCTYMDPMQRTILEKTFEAITDAGICRIIFSSRALALKSCL